MKVGLTINIVRQRLIQAKKLQLNKWYKTKDKKTMQSKGLTCFMTLPY